MEEEKKVLQHLQSINKKIETLGIGFNFLTEQVKALGEEMKRFHEQMSELEREKNSKWKSEDRY